MVEKPERKKDAKPVQWLLLLPALALLLCSFIPRGTETTSGMNAQEQRIASALSRIDGAGDTYVVIYARNSSLYSETGVPTGALILARGAADIAVQLRLSLAVQTLLNLPADSILIYPMEETP